MKGNMQSEVLASVFEGLVCVLRLVHVHFGI